MTATLTTSRQVIVVDHHIAGHPIYRYVDEMCLPPIERSEVAIVDRPCIHTAITAEHITLCCNTVECERCSKALTREQTGLSVDELLDPATVVLCSDCQWDCGSGQCDPNTGCPSCNDDDRSWVRAR